MRFFSSPSDSLSSTINVLFQRRIYLLLNGLWRRGINHHTTCSVVTDHLARRFPEIIHIKLLHRVTSNLRVSNKLAKCSVTRGEYQYATCKTITISQPTIPFVESRQKIFCCWNSRNCNNLNVYTVYAFIFAANTWIIDVHYAMFIRLSNNNNFCGTFYSRINFSFPDPCWVDWLSLCVFVCMYRVRLSVTVGNRGRVGNVCKTHVTENFLSCTYYWHCNFVIN